MLINARCSFIDISVLLTLLLGACGGGNTSNPDGQMYRCLLQCDSNEDCPPANSCVDGSCTFTGCTSDADCKESNKYPKGLACFPDSDNINRCWLPCESQEECFDPTMDCVQGACRYTSWCPTEGTCDDQAREFERPLGTVCIETALYPLPSCRYTCTENADCQGIGVGDSLAECREGNCVPHSCDPADISTCDNQDGPDDISWRCALTVWDGDT